MRPCYNGLSGRTLAGLGDPSGTASDRGVDGPFAGSGSVLSPSVEGPSGIQRARTLYGIPVEWWCRYDVRAGGIDYWQHVAASRSAEVVLVLRRPSGRILLHTKDRYPSGAYRLPTGGVRPGEDLVAAVVREGAEETGLRVSVERFLGIIHQTFAAGDQSTALDSHILQVTAEDRVPAPEDSSEGITGFTEVTAEGLLAVADELEGLAEPFEDWGRFRATAHRLVYEALTGRSANHG